MAEKRYIYASVGLNFEILDSWFGYTGDDEPTEREIEEYDYLVIGLAPDQDSADGICRRLNDQQDELNHLSNFGLHVILDKKNKEIEQLKQYLGEYCNFSLHDLLAKKNKEIERLKSTLAYRSNQLALMEQLIDDLGHEEMKRQMEEILQRVTPFKPTVITFRRYEEDKE